MTHNNLDEEYAPAVAHIRQVLDQWIDTDNHIPDTIAMEAYGPLSTRALFLSYASLHIWWFLQQFQALAITIQRHPGKNIKVVEQFWFLAIASM